MANENKVKYIHRTLTYWTGKEIIADFETMQFSTVDRIWYDELDIPKGRVKDVQKHTKSYRMALDDFIRLAELEPNE